MELEQQSVKRARSRLSQQEEEHQYRVNQQYKFQHFIVDCKSTWIQCFPLHPSEEAEDHEFTGILYSHRQCGRPLLVQRVDEGYLLHFQANEDEIAVKFHETGEASAIEELLGRISASYREQPWLCEPTVIDVLECAFCQLVGIDQQPMDAGEMKPRRIIKAQRRLVEAMEEEQCDDNG